jgi:protein-arginine kinase
MVLNTMKQSLSFERKSLVNVQDYISLHCITHIGKGERHFPCLLFLTNRLQSKLFYFMCFIFIDLKVFLHSSIACIGTGISGKKMI